MRTRTVSVTVAGVRFVQGQTPADLGESLIESGATDPAVVFYPTDGEIGVVTQWKGSNEAFRNALAKTLAWVPKPYQAEVTYEEVALSSRCSPTRLARSQCLRRSYHSLVRTLRCVRRGATRVGRSDQASVVLMAYATLDYINLVPGVLN